MIVVTCDVCGKEINNNDIRVTISVGKIGLSPKNDDYNVVKHFCREHFREFEKQIGR